MNVPELYKQHYIDRQFERADLFDQLGKKIRHKKSFVSRKFCAFNPIVLYSSCSLR